MTLLLVFACLVFFFPLAVAFFFRVDFDEFFFVLEAVRSIPILSFELDEGGCSPDGWFLVNSV